MSPSVSSPPPRLISDELWALVEPLIPPRRPAIHGRTGRPRTADRDALEGISFVLSTGIGWTKLPTELGYGSGWTCWRRLREWADDTATGDRDEVPFPAWDVFEPEDLDGLDDDTVDTLVLCGSRDPANLPGARRLAAVDHPPADHGALKAVVRPLDICRVACVLC